MKTVQFFLMITILSTAMNVYSRIVDFELSGEFYLSYSQTDFIPLKGILRIDDQPTSYIIAPGGNDYDYQVIYQVIEFSIATTDWKYFFFGTTGAFGENAWEQRLSLLGEGDAHEYEGIFYRMDPYGPSDLDLPSFMSFHYEPLGGEFPADIRLSRKIPEPAFQFFLFINVILFGLFRRKKTPK
jgi:hypothetical protein